MEGFCAGGRPDTAAGQGWAPASEAGGMEGDQGGASKGGQVGASEGGLGSAAGGKDATLENLLRSSAPGLGHGAQEGLTPSGESVGSGAVKQGQGHTRVYPGSAPRRVKSYVLLV
jgi:hypothetical protein